MLEAMLGGQRVQRESQRVYQIVDLRGLGAIALYTAPSKGFDFPESGFQFHIHETQDGKISGGNMKPYGETYGVPLNNFQVAMGDYWAKQLGIKPIDFNKL